jgi:SAM-dependent methyltransferase
VVSQLKEGVTKVHVFERQLASARGRLLDVGCGVGETMRFVADGLTVIGADLDLAYCGKARAAGERTVCADLAAPLPFRDGAFDAALCSDTFEHLVDPLALLSDLHRVLRPGGLLLCHVPNEFSHKSLRQIVRGNGICNRTFFPGAEEWDYPHLRFFSHRGFVRMLARGGFVVEEDLTDFGRGWRRRLYPLFGSGPSICARKAAGRPA